MPSRNGVRDVKDGGHDIIKLMPGQARHDIVRKPPLATNN